MIRGLLLFLYRSYIKSCILNTFLADWSIRLTNAPVLARMYRRVYLPFILKKTKISPRQIAIEGYNVCNLKCTMCPYPVMTRKKEQMPMALFKKIVDESCSSGFKELNLTLYSEPLMDDLLFERIAYAKTLGLVVGFTTNATLLSPEKIRLIFESGLDWIAFSIDGATKENYESIRLGADFEKVCSNIREFLVYKQKDRSIKPLVVVHTTIQTRNNLNSSGRLRDILKGADYFTCALADARRNHDYLFTGSFFPKGRKMNLYPCPILWGAPTITSSGQAVICCKDYDATMPVGDLNHQSLEDILGSKKLRAIRELHLNGKGNEIELCKNCDSLYRANLSWWAGTEVSVKENK